MLGVDEEREEASHFGGERTLLLATLEGVLFLAREPLSTRKLAQFAGLADGTEARTLVRKLNELYDAEGCAFRVEEVAGGLQLMSRPKFAPWLRRLQAVPVEIRLSSPALETLAVVAYRQPVLRAEIEAIRGVQCGEILRVLMERDMVRIVGRSEELGRPFLYGTTRLFLQIFGLRHLDELPRPELLDGVSPGPSGREATPIDITRSDKEAVNHLTGDFSQGEEATVKTRLQPVMLQEPQDIAFSPVAGAEAMASMDSPRAYKDDDDEEFGDEELDEDEGDDLDDDEDEDLDDDEEDEDEDDDLDEDDFEDEDWEEVEDDEDLDEDDDEDEDWDDDDDWEDDDEEDDDDWDDDEEDEGDKEKDADE
jgi:segregation and condensation protein B